jgi:hypothetical protein
LKQKNYDDLREEHHTARILALLVLPDVANHWLQMSEECLTLYRGCYWLSLKNLPPRSNSSSTTIHIPRENLFTIAVLDVMMLGIAERRTP